MTREIVEVIEDNGPVIEPIEVFRGRHGQEPLFGPLPGVRLGDVLAYEFELPDSFEPWPGRTLLERTFVLLDLGVSFANPCWVRRTTPDGAVVDRTDQGSDRWYVDLITVERDGDQYTCRDLYIDVMVPMDGRHYRMLDLDDYAAAIDDGLLNVAQATDGLHRWQRFLDRHLHTDRAPIGTWSDFPPAAIRPLLDLPPFGDSVQWTG
ncbi:MAG: DUF402 domain-containing protein [Chloroflexi bacterium]|nr:DUF402 domain-containing protein [Chloroflexota bacterium]